MFLCWPETQNFLTQTATTIGGRIPIVRDVSGPVGVSRAFDEVKIESGGADILINNAAIAIPQPIDEVDGLVAKQEVAVNLLGHFFVCARPFLNFGPEAEAIL